jgi:hypothetical protein
MIVCCKWTVMSPTRPAMIVPTRGSSMASVEKSNILDRIVDNSPVAFRSRWTALFFFMGPVVST